MAWPWGSASWGANNQKALLPIFSGVVTAPRPDGRGFQLLRLLPVPKSPLVDLAALAHADTTVAWAFSWPIG